MVGKKSGKALLREEGLERTDNSMNLTTWPQAVPINQKNYYTEYLKRDDQVLPLRLMQEERREQMTDQAKDRDRALNQTGEDELAPDMEAEDDAEDEDDEDIAGSKTIVIHPGSQNLRIGLASDAIPKTIPMVVARRSEFSESEEIPGEPYPKRRKYDDGRSMPPEKMFGEEFSSQYNQMCNDLKIHMRANKRRVLPNSKELIVNYNKRAPPDTIPMHNDPLQIDWTELPAKADDAPGYICGKEALRIPEKSNPRYKLYWPMRLGWLNEADYEDRRDLYDDFATILAEAIKSQLGLQRRREWASYKCVFIIPDLYERKYVIQVLAMLMREFGFLKVSLIQESLAATFGAGFIASCVVDVGAQKTSVCCVEEGTCVENSRVNLKFGGADVTETFIKMMLFDHFPYAEINLKRRHDFLLAEELKTKFCTLNEQDVSPQLFDFHLRASGQDTRKYTFKTYDEVLLAPQGFFQPSIFDNANKLDGRRKLIRMSEDIYDASPNDPESAAQSTILATLAPPSIPINNAATNGVATSKEIAQGFEKKAPNLTAKLADTDPASTSAAGTPLPDGEDTAMQLGEDTIVPQAPSSSLRDDVLPIIPLEQAILISIDAGSRGDERKIREYLGQIMVIGGGAQVPGFYAFLEQKLKEARPGWAKDILIGTPPRELDPQGVVWKGGSVFGKLRSSSDSWIGRVEYDRLGARLLAYKCMWAW